MEETTVKSNAGKGLSIAALIIGIIAAIISLIPIVGFVAYILALVGLVLAIIGLIQAIKGKASKGMAIAGLILNTLAFIIPWIYPMLFAGAAMNELNNIDTNQLNDVLQQLNDSLQ
ncbi:MAG: hypothetical protein COZ59_07545 [Bacteroidetes bacterium CG_4_8_14_3_um_filter_31_14]|nr:MAG: hypothetical protein COZ59_07545 [Bacteroidetes bacterium CG_4_8_14_3_um_filter_31_14]